MVEMLVLWLHDALEEYHFMYKDFFVQIALAGTNRSKYSNSNISKSTPDGSFHSHWQMSMTTRASLGRQEVRIGSIGRSWCLRMGVQLWGHWCKQLKNRQLLVNFSILWQETPMYNYSIQLYQPHNFIPFLGIQRCLLAVAVADSNTFVGEVLGHCFKKLILYMIIWYLFAKEKRTLDKCQTLGERIKKCGNSQLSPPQIEPLFTSLGQQPPGRNVSSSFFKVDIWRALYIYISWTGRFHQPSPEALYCFRLPRWGQGGLDQRRRLLGLEPTKPGPEGPRVSKAVLMTQRLSPKR